MPDSCRVVPDRKDDVPPVHLLASARLNCVSDTARHLVQAAENDSGLRVPSRIAILLLESFKPSFINVHFCTNDVCSAAHICTKKSLSILCC